MALPPRGAGTQIISNYLKLSQIISNYLKISQTNSKEGIAHKLGLAIFEQAEGRKMEAERRPLSPEG